jgi:hypothetical protein
METDTATLPPSTPALRVVGDPEPHGHLERAEERDGEEHPVVSVVQRPPAAGRPADRDELRGPATHQRTPQPPVVPRGVRHLLRDGHLDADGTHESTSLVSELGFCLEM